MLAPLIVFMLYILFLKDTYLDSLKSSLGEMKEYIDMKDIDSIANAWLLAGILASSCITVSLNSLQVMVLDKNNKIDYDYNSSPISNISVILAYFTGAFINTFMIAGGILTIGLIIINSISSLYLSFTTIILLYLVTILGSASATIIMMIIVSFFKRSSAIGAFSGIVSAAIGFIIGAYIPLSSLSDEIQGILSLVPGSHVACLYRNLLMDGLMNHINSGLNGIGGGAFNNIINDAFALNLNMFSYKTTTTFMSIYSSSSIVVALGINVILYKQTLKR